jgi:chromosomal replication initiation ATPase DnaA
MKEQDDIKTICLLCETSYNDLLSRSRIEKIVATRAVCAWYLKRYKHLSLKDIGELLRIKGSSVYYLYKITDEADKSYHSILINFRDKVVSYFKNV